MIDIETMATCNNAAIVAIGACAFDLEGLGEEFTALIDTASASAHGAVQRHTMEWWASQSEEVRDRMFGGKEPAEDAAERLLGFFKAARADEVWANSPTFDCVILRNWFDEFDMNAPWHYRQERCVRTIYAIANSLKGIDVGAGYSESGAHDANVDARNQARAVTIALKGLGVEK